MKNFLLFLNLLLISSCYTSYGDLWCFTGGFRELRCHSTKQECVDDWHRVWDRDIIAGIQHPLYCAKLE